MNYVYFVCVGARGAQLGEFAVMRGFANSAAALIAAEKFRESRGGTFERNHEEEEPGHVALAWSSASETVWLERLPVPPGTYFDERRERISTQVLCALTTANTHLAHAERPAVALAMADALIAGLDKEKS